MKRMILIAIFSFLLILLFEGISRADSPKIENLPAKTSWVVHVDIKHIRDSIPKECLPSLDFMLTQACTHMVKIDVDPKSKEDIEHFNHFVEFMRIFKSLDSITIAGFGSDSDYIMELNAKYNPEKLRKILGMNKNSKVKTYNKIDIYDCSNVNNKFFIAFIGESKILSASSAKLLINQIDISAKKGKSLSKDSALGKLITANADKSSFFTVAIVNFDKLVDPEKLKETIAVRKIKSVHLNLCVNKCKKLADLTGKLSLKITTEKNSDAVKMSKIYEGLVALMELHEDSDINAKILITSLEKKFKVVGKELRIDWSLKYATLAKKAQELWQSFEDLKEHLKSKVKIDNDFATEDPKKKSSSKAGKKKELHKKSK